MPIEPFAHRQAQALARRVLDRERGGIARALNVLDDARPAGRELSAALLQALPPLEATTDAHLVGFTGPPGAGKSTLVSALIRHWRGAGQTVGVLAVDPSSPIGGGALLGDRLRMQVAADDDGVFIRSLASRGSFGGLAPQLLPMAAVMLNAYDQVVIETVGVGQREVEVAFVADTTCLVVQPGAGDSIQYLKAGIMETPDLLVVNKADLGALANATLAELRASLPLAGPRTLLSTSALHDEGIAALAEALLAGQRRAQADGRLASRRRDAAVRWVRERLLKRFGEFGLERLGGERALQTLLTASSTPVLAAADALESTLSTLLSPRTQLAERDLAVQLPPAPPAQPDTPLANEVDANGAS